MDVTTKTERKRKTRMMYANLIAFGIIMIIFIINLVFWENALLNRGAFLTLSIPYFGVLLIGGIFTGLIAFGAARGAERLNQLRRNISFKAYAIQIGILNCAFAIISIITFNQTGEVVVLDYISFGLWMVSGILTLISPFLGDNATNLDEAPSSQI